MIAGLLSEVARALRGVVTPNEKLGPFGLPWLGELPPPIGEVELANGIGAADTKGISRRASEFERYIDSGYGFPPLIHPRAFVAREATIGPGTQLMAGAILQPYAQIGRNVIVNTGAQIDHHCCIGDHAHIAPGAILCGDVTVEAGAMVGAGAVVLPGSKVTTGTLVKAASRFPLRGRLDRGLERPRAIRPLAGQQSPTGWLRAPHYSPSRCPRLHPVPCRDLQTSQPEYRQRHRQRLRSVCISELRNDIQRETTSCTGDYWSASLQISSSNRRESLSSWLSARRSAKASLVYWPHFSALLLPVGAPDPGAPPCMRQRFLPLTAGAWQGVLRRVLAPQRGLSCIAVIMAVMVLSDIRERFVSRWSAFRRCLRPPELPPGR